MQNDRQDKSALGWEHIEKVDKHESQKGNIFNIIQDLIVLEYTLSWNLKIVTSSDMILLNI